ncbi:MAG: hypothetical protein GPJ54_15285 [Candidatus Heimdallarchaeota archaeon]|nr:hypothetical protein [Candidatus Heimdallarchaeota archaeon]
MNKKDLGFLILSLLLLNSMVSSKIIIAQDDKTKHQIGILLYTVEFNKVYNFRDPDIESVSLSFTLERKQDAKSVSLGINNIKTGEIGFHNVLNRTDQKYEVTNDLLTNEANDNLDFEYLGKTTNEEFLIINEDGTELGLMVPQRELDSFVLNSINVDILQFTFNNLGYSTDITVEIIWEFWGSPGFKGLASTTRNRVTVEEESSILLLPFPFFSVIIFLTFITLIHRRHK